MILDPSHHLTLSVVRERIRNGSSLFLDPHAQTAIEKCRHYLAQKVKKEQAPIYGVNTGFGSLCDRIISPAKLADLQVNLLLSHACGTGQVVPKEIVKIMLLLKAKSLSKGYSGVQVETVKRLVDMYNADITPVVYEQGSLGASGDLAPLAHLCLPLIGEGEVLLDNQLLSGKQLLEEMDWVPIKLAEKEGLALINGTQFMSAYGVWCLTELIQLLEWANKIAAVSMEAFGARTEPFLEHSHAIRPHFGQQYVAKKIREYREKSEIAASPKNQVQDPYSFRCVPQVHGASYEVFKHAMGVFEVEINGVTDNPNVFVEEDKIISGGNFHGQILAMQLDFAAIAAAELASISERRTYKLIAGERGLPPFLAVDPGLHSGYMIAQYTAAGIVSQNKQLCTPASVDSIVSSNGQEDHVSMGANAATKLYRVVENLRTVLAIELLCAAQAMHFKREMESSPVLHQLLVEFRKIVPFRKQDVFLHQDIQKAIEFIKNTKSKAQ
jgi:histidine ammonia-lyase